MPLSHPLITQLRFTRAEFLRGLDGLTTEEATRRFEAMNPISWMVGHLAWHEQALWLERAQGKVVAPAVKGCRFGAPPSEPPFDDMLAAWRAVTEATDPYLDTLTSERWSATGRRRQEASGEHRYQLEARHLPLLVSPRRVAGGPADAGPSRPARLRRQYQ